jgi:predicted alpha-1,6-mannanase (GH76 family)
LSSRKRRTHLCLLAAPLLLGLAALFAALTLGGQAAGAVTPGSTTTPSVVTSWATSSPAPDAASDGLPVSPPASPIAAAASPSPASPASPAATRGVTAARADAAIDSFDRAFYVQRGGRGFFRATTASTGYAAFWRTAEMIEMVEDAAQRSGDPVYRRMVGELTRGVSWRWGGNWTAHRRYNDDVMWMVLAFVRAYAMTGDQRLRDVAKRNFDAVFARGWSADLGGGLWWTSDRNEKNACVNAPAAIAAVRLAGALGDPRYLKKAKRLYAWVRRTLFDAQTGAVYDHVFRDGEGNTAIDRATYTYNQGSFSGAGVLLHRATREEGYWSDAGQALAFARSDLTEAGVLREEGDGGDGGGFKGVLARYAGDYLRRDATRTYEDWLAQNGEAAWSHRDGRGLMAQDWSSPTPKGELHAFDASSAVVLLQQLRGR